MEKKQKHDLKNITQPFLNIKSSYIEPQIIHDVSVEETFHDFILLYTDMQ